MELINVQGGVVKGVSEVEDEAPSMKLEEEVLHPKVGSIIPPVCSNL